MKDGDLNATKSGNMLALIDAIKGVAFGVGHGNRTRASEMFALALPLS
jgi:hypothetical protein